MAFSKHRLNLEIWMGNEDVDSVRPWFITLSYGKHSYKLWQKCSYEANIDGHNTMLIIILCVYRNHILKLVNTFPICSWWRNYILLMGYLVSPIQQILNINNGRFTRDLYKIIGLKIHIEHPKVSQKWPLNYTCKRTGTML